MGWTKRSLNRNYLTKMLNKQVEMKEDAIRRQREENLSKYLDSNKEKPSVNKKVNSNIKYARNMLITLPINALNNKRKTINGKPIHKEGLS